MTTESNLIVNVWNTRTHQAQQVILTPQEVKREIGKDAFKQFTREQLKEIFSDMEIN